MNFGGYEINQATARTMVENPAIFEEAPSTWAPGESSPAAFSVGRELGRKTADGLYFRLQGFASADAGSAQVLRLFLSTLLTDRQAALRASLEFPPRGARRPPSDFRHEPRH